jgi:hypothetical protein
MCITYVHYLCHYRLATGLTTTHRMIAMPRLSPALLLVLFVVGFACDGQDPAAPVDEVADAFRSGSGVISGIYSPERLRIRAEPIEVLVAIDSDTAISVWEFNHRLREFPIEDEGQSLLDARKSVLSRMIDYKTIAREGLRRHHPDQPLPSNDPLHPFATEKFLAESVIQRSVAIPGLVSDEDAAAFARERGEAFDRAAGEASSEQERMIFAKILLLDQRWRAQVETWRKSETIEIFDDNLEDRKDS